MTPPYLPPSPITTCCTGLPLRDIVRASTRTRGPVPRSARRRRLDLLATAGLDDRKSSGGYPFRAEELMADAVGAEQRSSLPAAARCQ